MDNQDQEAEMSAELGPSQILVNPGRMFEAIFKDILWKTVMNLWWELGHGSGSIL